MESLYLLIPIAIIIVAIAVAVFFWAVKSGQYDDLDTEASRILFDEPDQPLPDTASLNDAQASKSSSHQHD
ncbi:cbb3-type cytochrome oxidase assembly protein CcoS [Marinagarivorans algicola]|uniref:cbb3-type cytochrome oxidase assembly protein CcoS n=1 Tax=Marinagarivorans algicola TaxID=1513270 RepID=UPI0006B55B30|nr:cbb3-type cytochrome oxidase assembly protein CcoS [Marinagarivorans algicola]